MPFQGDPQVPVFQRLQTRPGQHDQVQTFQEVLVCAKAFAYLPLDAVPGRGPGNASLRYRKSKARSRQAVGAEKDREASVSRTISGLEDPVKLLRSRQSPTPAEAHTRLSQGSRDLGAQAYATLGATGGDDPTPAFGGHAGAKPMPTFALEVARLKGSLHGSGSLITQASIRGPETARDGIGQGRSLSMGGVGGGLWISRCIGYTLGAE